MAQVDFQPLSDFVLLEPLANNMTAGGVALPEGANPDPPKGRVVKCGPGRFTEYGVHMPMLVKEGDVVYVITDNGRGMEIKLGGKTYGIVRMRDLVATVPQRDESIAAIEDLATK